ncbi:MAG: 3-phosphoshikimate 1-carboxyvinyltransferase [Elusimicrobiota bacterium]|jgi:3-phosphoshikimate 1-carboxyvinyltransferase|nr:3-phosphoshikimate 1-carboxyvinyltransferase [Elusimicrobiota bacterium]
MDITLSKVSKISGIIEPPSDKSITHRAIMLSSIADGMSIIKNYLPSDDCKSTIKAFQNMGVEIKIEEDKLFIKGNGLRLKKPVGKIDAGNSGTTTRLLSGILSGQNFTSELFGDESLSKRPMKRIIDPLCKMGAQIKSNAGETLPMEITGKYPLNAIKYQSDKSSAQIKSAVLFAGLYADGQTIYSEPVKSRDHSEKMLSAFGADIKTEGNTVFINPPEKLNPLEITVPGDISSAAFFIAAALLVPNSNLIIKNVGINPTRDAIIGVLKQMGADICLENLRNISGEPVGDIIVKHSDLKAIDIDGKTASKMIDEIPIFALIAANAKGTTKITGAKELRVKESDRIKTTVIGLKSIGVEVKELEDGFIINGKSGAGFNGAVIDSYFDHRIAMTFSIASLIAQEPITIKNAQCVDISFPNFYKELRRICL